MTSDDSLRPLQAFQVQLIQAEDGIRLRRGCTEVRIKGERAAEIVRGVLRTTLGRMVTREEICQSFAAPDRPAVLDLIGELEKRRILTPVEGDVSPVDEREGPLDIFYWHFDEYSQAVAARLAAQKIVVVGVNHISHQIVSSLVSSHVSNIQIVDQPLLRNPELFDNESMRVSTPWPGDAEPVSYDAWTPDQVGCLVATSEYGGARLLREWNRFCLDHGCHFMPVVLQDLIGYVGPLVVPGETACFECMLSRWSSNLDGQESRWETLDSDGQSLVGYHPAMATMLGAITAFELTKFYGLRLPFVAVGRLIEVNLLTMDMEARRVLRLPRCTACSSLNTRPPASLTKSWFGFGPDEEM